MIKHVLTAFIFSIHVQIGFSQSYNFQTSEGKVEASFRGLSVVDNLVAWVSGSKGWIGKTKYGGVHWDWTQIQGCETLEFRSLYAFDSLSAIVANAGSPAKILQTTNGGKSWNIVYENNHPDAFFDGVDFWNSRDGIIYGDPIDGKMLILKTNDGGKTWAELSGSSRPVLQKDEASFAASGTGIRCFGDNKVVIATGGKVSRLLVSENGGEAWKSISPPVIQGKKSTGIFSFAFRDAKHGIIVGGDYEQDTLRKDHIFFTENGGKSWKSPRIPTRGYRECVEYISDKHVVAVGPGGIDISYDGGENWEGYSDEKNYHVARKARSENLVILAGGKGALGVLLKAQPKPSLNNR